jgi:hypothetical protein
MNRQVADRRRDLIAHGSRRVNRRRESLNIRRRQRNVGVCVRRICRTRRSKIGRDHLLTRCDIVVVQRAVEVS